MHCPGCFLTFLMVYVPHTPLPAFHYPGENTLLCMFCLSPPYAFLTYEHAGIVETWLTRPRCMNLCSNPSEFHPIYPILVLKVSQFFLNESFIRLCSDSTSLPYATGKFH